MLVAFWSGWGNKDTAAVLSLTAIAGCLCFPRRVLTLENYLNSNNLGFHLIGERYNEIKKRYSYNSPEYYAVGDSFLQHIKRETGRSIRHNRCVEIIPDALYFLPLNQSIPRDVYEYGFEREWEELLEYGEEFYDLVYVNLEQNKNITTMRILERADMVVACLPSDCLMFEDFRKRYPSVLEKSMVVICGENARCGAYQLRSRHPEYATKIVPFEFSPSVLAELSEGRVMEYFCIHFYDDIEIREYSLIRQAKKLAAQIIDYDKHFRLNEPMREVGNTRGAEEMRRKSEEQLMGYARELEKLHRMQVAEKRRLK